MQILCRIPTDAKVVEFRDLYLYDSLTGVCMPISNSMNSPQIFWAEYSRTDYDEMLTAYKAEKLLVCKNGNLVGWFKQLVDGRFEFVQSAVNGDVVYTLWSDGKWSTTKTAAGYITSPNGTKWALGVSDTGEITAISTPIIDKQPSDATAYMGNTVEFSIEAHGGTSLKYDWYIKRPTELYFSKWTSTQNPQFDCAIGNNGAQFYCVVSDLYGNSITSNTVILTVIESEFAITKQPVDYVGPAWTQVNFAVDATGAELAYQWYIKRYTDDDFSIWAGKNKKTATFTPSDSNMYLEVYCTVTDIYGETLTSDIVSFTMLGSLELAEKATAITVTVGTQVYFYVKPKNVSDTYQWYIKRPTETEFSKWSGKNTAITYFQSSMGNNGMQVYCQVTSDEDGESITTQTGIATLTVTS